MAGISFATGSDGDAFGLCSPAAPNINFSFSRTSSTGSIDLLPSSAQNTDSTCKTYHSNILFANDEDSDLSDKSALTYKERRRSAHTQAEQKRRDAIKKGYSDLQFLVPTCQQQDISSYKLSKATILQRSIDYIQFLITQKKKQEDELNALRKEVVALEIMKENYENIVKVHMSQPIQNSNKLTDEIKFQVFKALCDTLFQSFDSCISVQNFGELSACVFSWLEEYCKPETLQDMMLSLLCQLSHQIT